MEQEPRKEGTLLKGKVAIVTGGASGIGKAIAKDFLMEGATVAVFDIKGTDEALEELSDYGQVKVFTVDITKENQIRKALEGIEESLGHTNVLVNNAGIDPEGLEIQMLPSEDWNHILDVNLTGSFLVTKVIGGRMIDLKIPGNIIFISSIHTAHAFEKEAAYDASKHGIIGLMRITALDWGKFGIRSNAISPGFIHPTGINNMELTSDEQQRLGQLIPIGRTGKPDDIASVASFLASDKASFVHGAELRVDGGSAIRTTLY